VTAIAAPARLLRPRRLLAAAVALALAGLVAAQLLLFADEPPSLRTVTAPGGAFELDYPAGWTAADAEDLLADPARPAALVRRGDGRGLVVVHQRARLDGSLEALQRDLRRQVERRLPDARPVAMRTVRLSTGPALSYTFVREESGLVQGIVAAPTGDRTYLIDSVAHGDAPDVARQIGAIVRSLRVPR
jgi:hypothetical protein